MRTYPSVTAPGLWHLRAAHLLERDASNDERPRIGALQGLQGLYRGHAGASGHRVLPRRDGGSCCGGGGLIVVLVRLGLVLILFLVIGLVVRLVVLGV